MITRLTGVGRLRAVRGRSCRGEDRTRVDSPRKRPRHALKLKLFAGLLAAPLVSACVSSTPLPAPKVQPPVAFEAPRPSSEGLAPTALDRWWTLYADAQLDALVDRALASSPDARDAIAKLEQAAAIREQNIAQLYIPTSTLSATATENYTKFIESAGTIGGGAVGGGGGFLQGGAVTNLTGSFTSAWELDLWGRRRAGRDVINSDFYTAALTFEATRISLAASVAQSLFQARGLALQLRDAVETARITRELARIAGVKAKSGLGSRADQDQTAANAEAADAQVESLTAQLTGARRTLLVLIGQGFDPLASLEATATVGTVPPVPDQVPGELLRRRPDIRAAESRLNSATATLKVNELALLPTIRLNPGFTLSKNGGPFGATTAAWSVGANLSAPVLDRPRLLAAIRAQHAVAEQQVIAYEKAVQTAYGDTENAFVFLASDRRRVDMLSTAETRAKSAYDKASLGYARGLNDLQTALSAETSWRNIRTQLTNAQATLMQRSVQVFRSLGGGWSPDQVAAASTRAGLVASVAGEK